MLNLYKYFNNSSILDNQQLYEDAISSVITYHTTIDVYQRIEQTNWEKIKHIVKKIPDYAANHAVYISKERWLEAEPYILKDSRQILFYTVKLMQGRWPEGEAALLSNQNELDSKYVLYLYAKDVIKGRWPEAEPFIMLDYEAIYYYAEYVIRGRWPEGEQAMLSLPFQSPNNDVHYLYWYANMVMKERWLAAEPLIKLDNVQWCEYCTHFNV